MTVIDQGSSIALKTKSKLNRIYSKMRFDDMFHHGEHENGRAVSFTPTESKLLQTLSQRPGKILNRDFLLDAISNRGSEKLDRNIDYFINRIRTKLNDPPKEPQFISTRYGEGYIWLPSEGQLQPLAAGAHAVVGPLLGLTHIGTKTQQARQFATHFHQEFRNRFDASLDVVYDPECPKASAFDGDCPEISIEITFLSTTQKLECIFQGRYFESGRVFYVARQTIADEPADALDVGVVGIAAQVAEQIWRRLALVPKDDVPLTVSMIDAGTKFTSVKGNWRENDEPLRDAVASNRSDHRVAIMLATNIHTKYLQDGIDIFGSDKDPRQDDENEIEQLVTAALPHLHNDPPFRLMAAKLLFFIDQGYRPMAIEIAEEASAQCTSLGASLPIIGQMRMFLGQSQAGLACIDQALEQCEANTQHEVFLLILKCEALASIDDRTAINQVLKQLYVNAPAVRPMMELFFTDASNPSKAATATLGVITSAQGRAMLQFFHYVYARLLQQKEHRLNAYSTPVLLLLRQFGQDAIPDEVAALVPELLEQHTMASTNK